MQLAVGRRIADCLCGSFGRGKVGKPKEESKNTHKVGHEFAAIDSYNVLMYMLSLDQRA